MRHCIGMLATAALLLAPCVAPAADLAVKAPPVPPAVQIYDWTGIYVGLNGGYGWGKVDPVNLFDSRFDRNEFSNSGGMIGGTFGAQIQKRFVVLGLEGDLDWANINGSGITTPAIAGAPQPVTLSAVSKIDGLGTLRARAGVAMNNWLFYATGGGAVLHETASGSSIAGVACGTAGVIANCSASAWRPGVTGGLGVEWGITQNWSAKAEYLYVTAVGSGASQDHLNLVRAGLNYRF